jgi:hypothetical protein
VDEVAPAAKQITTFKLGPLELPVYQPDAIPLSVLADLFEHWPGDTPGERPHYLSSIEFAARKPGKGNNPWIIKVKGVTDPMVVSSGRGNVRVRPLQQLEEPEPSMAAQN